MHWHSTATEAMPLHMPIPCKEEVMQELKEYSTVEIDILRVSAEDVLTSSYGFDGQEIEF